MSKKKGYYVDRIKLMLFAMCLQILNNFNEMTFLRT